MREPSASKLALAEHCGHPWTSGKRWPPYEQSTFGAFGDRVHLGTESLSTDEVCYPAAYAGLDAAEVERVDGCVAAAAHYLAARKGTRHAELDLRYHVPNGTARRAAPTELRTKRPGEWTTRVDLVIDRGGVVDVVDWKTGRQEYTANVAQNWQLRLSALAAARAFGARTVRAALVYLEPGNYWEDATTFGALDLATIAYELRELRGTLTQGPTPPVPGPWCTQHYCPMVGNCPATQSALASAYPLAMPLAPVIRDDEHARYTLERLAGAEAALDAVKKAVRDYARTRPVSLGDGRVYGWRRKSKRSINLDTRERIAALREVLGTAADKAIRIEASATLEAIGAAAREILGPGKRGKKAIVDRALAALDAVGGLAVSEYEAPEVFTLKDEAAEAAEGDEA